MWAGDEDEHFERLMGAVRVAVDTESDPFHRYFERVCLIQLSDDERDWIFDPLEHESLPTGVRSLLIGSAPEIVLHGAESDVRALKQSFGCSIGPLFDTQLAAQFLGKPRTGLKDLLMGELGVEIDKGEQRSDWGARPLTDSQIAYARQDTQHLLALASTLQDQLKAMGRLSWHREECEIARTREPTVKVFDPESWRKIKGSRGLGAVGRRVLCETVAWRDGVARAKNRPAFRIIRSDPLLRLARYVERDGEKAIPRLMNDRIVPKGTDRMGLAEAMRIGLKRSDPGKNRPAPPAHARKAPKSPETKLRLDALKEARVLWADELGLDAGFMLPATLIDQVAFEAPSKVADLKLITGMTEWRIEALSDRILKTTRVLEAPKGC